MSSIHAARPPAPHDLAAAPADIVVAHRRVDQIAERDVIILPELVYLPEPARGDRHPHWLWREQRSALLPNAHQWRWVHDVEELADDPEGIGSCVSYGFVLLRVSDDQPNQGGECNDLILCMRGLDLVAVQVDQARDGEVAVRRDHSTESGTQ